MSPIAAPLARVLLRYLGGALIAKAGLSIDVNDPDMQNLVTLLIGGLLSATVEGWYVLARRRGWNL